MEQIPLWSEHFAAMEEAPAVTSLRGSRRPRLKDVSKKAIPEITYLLGESNERAHALAMKFKQDEELPLAYFFGPSGCGKSHLLKFLVQEMNLHKREKNKILLGRQLALDMKNALAEGRLASYVDQLVDEVDVLLIDDIEDILSSASLRVDFLYLINRFLSAHKRLALTGTLALNKIRTLGQKIYSRLQSGLTEGLGVPDPELKKRFFLHRSPQLVPHIPWPILERLSEKCHASFFALEGALRRMQVLTPQELSNWDIGNVLNQMALFPTLGEESKKKNDLNEEKKQFILQTVCAVFEVGLKDLISPSRKKIFVYPRHVAMFLLKERCGLTLEQVAQIFHRDHTTVMHALSLFKQMAEWDPKLKEIFRQLPQEF